MCRFVRSGTDRKKQVVPALLHCSHKVRDMGVSVGEKVSVHRVIKSKTQVIKVYILLGLGGLLTD